MQNHPSYPVLSQLLAKYPATGGALFQVYNDLTLAQRWTDVEVLDLPACKRAAIKGQRPTTDTDRGPSICVVVPCSLSESISTSWLRAAFTSLDPLPSEIYVAITSEDTSTVYYKISQGIVKPPV
ncbi:hypothetical protein CY34DRAFT_319389 [Suillus luteus UH-Slu-Lm8-n1]|uniref:tRNA-splicing endonuclease subunit Sen15 domain-containing protein n=1 Tax=Suillus luteus UH-Slu-Lm8-n1 TaxID=930992 RepID=A0A0D0BMN7_9AGAM|nr:hypothetical protein CY34DRAFT_319389 [Suillus luteus UH-Slu-Lm8-n1]